MRCILHIGRPKTGSTALQEWLYANSSTLSKHGYFMSGVCGYPNNINMAAYFGRSNGKELVNWRNRRGLQKSETQFDYLNSSGFIPNFESEVDQARASADFFLLTSEHFSSAIDTHDRIRNFTSYLTDVFDSIEVISYVRLQSETIPSGWSTALKSGGKHSLEKHIQEAITSNRLDLSRYAQQWTSVVGTTDCRFYWFNSSQDWDIRQHFCENALRLSDYDDFVFSKGRTNKSLNRWQAESYRVINRLWPFWVNGSKEPNTKNIQMRGMVDKLLIGHGPPIALSKSERQRVSDHFASSNVDFDRRFRSGAPLSDLY